MPRIDTVILNTDSSAGDWGVRSMLKPSNVCLPRRTALEISSGASLLEIWEYVPPRGLMKQWKEAVRREWRCDVVGWLGWLDVHEREGEL